MIFLYKIIYTYIIGKYGIFCTILTKKILLLRIKAMSENNCKIKELNGREYRCFFELALKIMGGKWKPIILFQLSLSGVMRFGDLKRGIPEITQRMLTKQLRELEADQIIHREVYREVPPKVEYSLKSQGTKLIPILLEMREWGVNYEKEIRGENFSSDQGYEAVVKPEVSDIYKVVA